MASAFDCRLRADSRTSFGEPVDPEVLDEIRQSMREIGYALDKKG